MSLTYFLKNDKDVNALFKTHIGNIKNLFQMETGAIPFQTKTPMITPPPTENWLPSVNGPNVGTAYDYYIRAYIQRKNGLMDEKEVPLLLLEGARIIKTIYLNTSYLDDNGAFEEEFFEDPDSLENTIHEAWEMRTRYIQGENISYEELAEQCLLMTYIENHYRNKGMGLRPDGYKTVSKEEQTSLQQLMINTEKEEQPSFFTIQDKNHVHFNPDFDEASKLIGGADADLIIDNALIDIKTTKTNEYKGKEVYQLIGYYLLYQHSRLKEKPIERLGLYFSRFNQYVYLETQTLENEKDMDAFANDFFALIKSKRSL